MRNLKGLVSIDLFSLNGAQYHVGDSLIVSDQRADLRDRLMARTFRAKESVVWHGVEDNVYKHSSAPKVLAASKLLIHPDSSWLKAEPVGMLLINYSTDYLHEHFSHVDLGQGAYFLVMDDKHRIIYHPDKRKIGALVTGDFFHLLQGGFGSFIQRLENTDVLLSYTQITDKQWYVISIVPKDTLLAPMVKISQVGTIMLLTSFLLIAFCVWLFIVRIVRPIGAISACFAKFQQGLLAPD